MVPWETWKEIKAGLGGYSCGVQESSGDTAWCWGSGLGGVLGNAEAGETTKSEPVRVWGSGTWAAISPSLDHTLGTQSDGTAWAWGRCGHPSTHSACGGPEGGTLTLPKLKPLP